MRLSKSEFITYVNRYEQMLNEEDTIMTNLDINPEWKPSGWLNSFYDLLHDMCELKEDPHYGTTLDWFCWETEFGKREDMRIIEVEGGKSWDISNAAILYDYIMTVEKGE